MMREKKIRGIKRRIRAMHRRLNEDTKEFPIDYFYNNYWNTRLPADTAMMRSSKVSTKVKRTCVQVMLDKANELSKLKPDDGEMYRVVVLIDPPDFWNCQIIIFRGDTYYNSFFDRNNRYQSWTRLSEGDIKKDWSLKAESHLQTVGYKVELFNEYHSDDSPAYIEENWFIGEMEDKA